MIVDVVVVQVVVIYMCTRLMSNLTQAYIPLFLIDTLNLPKVCTCKPGDVTNNVTKFSLRLERNFTH